MPEAREWDGSSYDRISGPMEALGLEVLARLPLEGSETVLDAGCGSGRISDHDELFARLHAGLRPGGRLTAQCGGEGNITVLRARARDVVEREAYAGHFRSFSSPWNYAGAEQTRARLLAAGFASARCWLA